MSTLYAECDQALNAIRWNTHAGGMVVQKVHRTLFRKVKPQDKERFWLSFVTGVSIFSGHRFEKIRVWSSRPMRPSYVVEISKIGTNTWSETEKSAR